MQASSNRSFIRAVLVEDDVNFQNALTEAIDSAPDMELIGVANSLDAGLTMLDQMQFNVLLVDLGLPDGSGIDIIRAAHAKQPSLGIMVCTTFGDEMNVMQSIEAGAAGYLLKDNTPNNILKEIRSLHSGGSPISPLIARQILLRFRQNGKSASVQKSPALGNPATTLSERELEVLAQVTKGYTYDEIAELLSISRHTVLTYVRRIYKKLEVNSKTEAIYEARNQGLLSN